MKLLRYFILNVSLFALTSAAMAQSDPVVMTIDGKDVKLSEFAYSFKKNNSEGVIDRKTVEEYVPLFVNFKLKVAAAEDAGYDTLASMRSDLASYKEEMLLPTLRYEPFIEQQARITYDNTAKRFGDADVMVASHILVLMSPNATAAEQTAAKARIDSIYQALQGGADFAELARKCSDDKASAVRGGSLGQFGKGMMIPDFENAVFAMQKGDVSAPVKTTVGWHIIRLEDRHPFGTYEYHHDNIIKFLEENGIREASAKYMIDSLARAEGVEREVVVDRLFKQLTAKDEEQRNLAQEYYDGSLMYEICKKEIWDPADADSIGRESYFKKNKKQYKWSSPRYRGIIIYAKDQATADAALKLLKKEKNYKQWEKLLSQTFNTDSVKNVVTAQGLFTQGLDPTVDALAFKQSTEVKKLTNYPVAVTYGKMLKKPESIDDVIGEVKNDYRMAKEQQWVDTLRKKYTYSVNNDVLKQLEN